MESHRETGGSVRKAGVAGQDDVGYQHLMKVIQLITIAGCIAIAGAP
jgi:hypothetical protein